MAKCWPEWEIQASNEEWVYSYKLWDFAIGKRCHTVPCPCQGKLSVFVLFTAWPSGKLEFNSCFIKYRSSHISKYRKQKSTKLEYFATKTVQSSFFAELWTVTICVPRKVNLDTAWTLSALLKVCQQLIKIAAELFIQQKGDCHSYVFLTTVE